MVAIVFHVGRLDEHAAFGSAHERSGCATGMRPSLLTVDDALDMLPNGCTTPRRQRPEKPPSLCENAHPDLRISLLRALHPLRKRPRGSSTLGGSRAESTSSIVVGPSRSSSLRMCHSCPPIRRPVSLQTSLSCLASAGSGSPALSTRKKKAWPELSAPHHISARPQTNGCHGSTVKNKRKAVGGCSCPHSTSALACLPS